MCGTVVTLLRYDILRRHVRRVLFIHLFQTLFFWINKRRWGKEWIFFFFVDRSVLLATRAEKETCHHWTTSACRSSFMLFAFLDQIPSDFFIGFFLGHRCLWNYELPIFILLLKLFVKVRMRRLEYIFGIIAGIFVAY